MEGLQAAMAPDEEAAAKEAEEEAAAAADEDEGDGSVGKQKVSFAAVSPVSKRACCKREKGAEQE